MTWENTLQIALLILWLGIIANLVGNNIVSHRWAEETKFYDHHKDLDHSDESNLRVTHTGDAIATGGGVANTGVSNEPKPWYVERDAA